LPGQLNAGSARSDGWITSCLATFRELENVMERAVVLSTGNRIGTELIPDNVRTPPAFAIPKFAVPPEGISFKDVIANVEKRLIESTLEAAGACRSARPSS